MAGVNKVILVGNLGGDPEVRHLEGGGVVANFSIATTESYTNKEGQKVQNTEWHNIEMWNGLAKVAEQYLKKGNTIYLEGRIKSEQWQDKEGNNRRNFKIRANSMQMLSTRGQDGGAAPAVAPKNTSTQTPPAAAATPEPLAGDMDDLPF